MLTANQPALQQPRRPPEFDERVDRCAEELGMSRRDYLAYVGDTLCRLVVALNDPAEADPGTVHGRGTVP